MRVKLSAVHSGQLPMGAQLLGFQMFPEVTEILYLYVLDQKV